VLDRNSIKTAPGVTILEDDAYAAGVLETNAEISFPLKLGLNLTIPLGDVSWSKGSTRDVLRWSDIENKLAKVK